MYAHLPEHTTLKGYVETLPFTRLLHEKLQPVVRDGHFQIGYGVNEPVRYRFRTDYEFFTYSGRFEKSDNGFINQANGLYVQALRLPCLPDTALDMDTVFHFSMDETGTEFFYAPVISFPGPMAEPLPEQLTIVYANGTTNTVALNRLIMERQTQLPITLEYIDGFPVVTATRLDGVNIVDGTLFLETTIRLRNEPIIILDLRGNRGGMYATPINWFYRLLNINVPSKHTVLIQSAVFQCPNVQRELAGPPYSREYEMLRQVRPLEPFDERFDMRNYPPDAIHSNPHLIIILIDRNTASAGELMADLTFNLTNTLVIGQNSLGFLSTALNSWHYILPNSGVRFNFGTDQFVHPEGHLIEGRGLTPDIWVNGCALTATLGMLNKHMDK
jgi:hypothetical protein